MTQKKATRSRKVVERLESQLQKGKKPNKISGRTTTELVDLTDIDKKRIQRELDILKARVH